MRSLLSSCLVVAWTLSPFAAHAVDPTAKCLTGKLKEAAKYAQCRAAAESKAIKAGATADFSKCVSKVSSKWQKLESNAGGACPSTGEFNVMEFQVSQHVADLATSFQLEVVYSCAFPASQQTFSYGPGDDGAVRAGAPMTYYDDGGGTITDLNTGLMWEKKVGGSASSVIECRDETASCGNPHDALNRYAWTGDSNAFDGSVVTVFLEQLNNRCHGAANVSCSTNADCAEASELDLRCGFAGHRDWRLPNIKELMSIVDFARQSPTAHPAFHGASCGASCTNLANPACSCTGNVSYWSGTTHSTDATRAWLYTTAPGLIGFVDKALFVGARAVRGGLP